MEEVFTHVVVEGKPKWSWKKVLQVISSVMPTFRSTLKKKKKTFDVVYLGISICTSFLGCIHIVFYFPFS